MDKVILRDSEFDEWELRARETIKNLEPYVGEANMEHIGSTSVPGLAAKDVVDILIGVSAGRIRETAYVLQAQGYDLEGDFPDHCWLSYPSRKARQSIIHVVQSDSRRWTRRIAFRDLLRESSSARERYLAVKQLSASLSTNWDEYTQAKTSVVNDLLAEIGVD